MTNEEAINELEEMANALQIIPESKQGQAILKAIQALKFIQFLDGQEEK
jgi:hypothetical protein